MLPDDFTPSAFDVVIGRGKQIKQLAGNQMLYRMVHAIADDYNASDKNRKSVLLSHLVASIYEQSPGAGFVKKDPSTGKWYSVEEALARTSAAQAVRDTLHYYYKSSRQFKQKRRRQAKKEHVPVHHIPCSAVPLVEEEYLKQVRDVSPAFSTFNGTVVMSNLNMPNFQSAIKDDVASCCREYSSMDSSNTDLFSILAANFCPKSDTTTQSDPFEPSPIQEIPQHQRPQSSQQRLADILDLALGIDLPLLDISDQTSAPMAPSSSAFISCDPFDTV